MNTTAFSMDSPQIHKLISAASGDAALLYIFLQSGNALSGAEQGLNWNPSRVQCAVATLRQLGLWEDVRPSPVMSGERPQYSEKDVLQAMDGDTDFRALYGEVQRLLGRSLNTEELKIILGFVRYLGLPADVIVGGIVRGDKVYIASGSTEIAAYDRVVVFAMPSAIATVGEYFN